MFLNIEAVVNPFFLIFFPYKTQNNITSLPGVGRELRVRYSLTTNLPHCKTTVAEFRQTDYYLLIEWVSILLILGIDYITYLVLQTQSTDEGTPLKMVWALSKDKENRPTDCINHLTFSHSWLSFHVISQYLQV